MLTLVLMIFGVLAGQIVCQILLLTRYEAMMDLADRIMGRLFPKMDPPELREMPVRKWPPRF